MGLRAWLRNFVRAHAKRRLGDALLDRLERGRAEVGMPPLTREQRQDMLSRLVRFAPRKQSDGRTVWR